ncbi:hypothetical protein HKD37_09G025388 [Glycine soja]
MNKALKRLLQNSLRDLCSIWEAMNNMITMHHTEMKASFETNTHVVGHVFKVILYKKLLGMLARYVVGTIPLDIIHMFWRRLIFSDQGLSQPKVSITEEIETISKQFEELDVCGKVTLKEKVKTKCTQKKLMTKHQRSIKCVFRLTRSMWMHYILCKVTILQSNRVHRHLNNQNQEGTCPCWINFIHAFMISLKSIVDVKLDGNYGYRVIVALLGTSENSWSLVHNHLLKELAKWSDEYINLLGGIYRFEELKWSLLVDGLSMVTQDKWMNITDMRYVIASRYNVILVSLSFQQSMTFFPLRNQPPRDCFVHHIILLVMCMTIILFRWLSLTANNFVMVYTLSLSSKVTTYTIY